MKRKGEQVRKQASVTLTRAEAFRLYLSALNGEYEDETNAQSVAAWRRAMAKVARTFGFRDHYPEIEVKLHTNKKGNGE